MNINIEEYIDIDMPIYKLKKLKTKLENTKDCLKFLIHKSAI